MTIDSWISPHYRKCTVWMQFRYRYLCVGSSMVDGNNLLRSTLSSSCAALMTHLDSHLSDQWTLWYCSKPPGTSEVRHQSTEWQAARFAAEIDFRRQGSVSESAT
ncbi:hypothetical protein AJ80_07451 [Polytolypa hystricis UAMH7299]|uniref:Uncharacterized protein n=1 Tax=Polytolypa hystricis (strain UAMH7299) TaxID=1447883 RepID=A0A2B7XNU5_POLH7|nr:hypothetical protein AJ80_07451 [Polytolypa hystricis UAMH7299]